MYANLRNTFSPLTTANPAAAEPNSGDVISMSDAHAFDANMVGPFGGVTAAILLRAIQLHPESAGRDRPTCGEP
jgi:hypothetical protein